MSHPAWDAWIEILEILPLMLMLIVSHPAWDAWIEIGGRFGSKPTIKSHPAWDAWIEIHDHDLGKTQKCVASRMGCVDGNVDELDAFEGEVWSHPAWDAWIEIKFCFGS